MSTDDLHRIRRKLRQIDEDRRSTDYKAEHIKMQGLAEDISRNWLLFGQYMNQLHGQSEFFKKNPAGFKVLLNYLVEQRAGLQSIINDYRNDYIDVDVPEEVQERIIESRALLKRIRDFKALMFIISDIDNDYALNPHQSDDESKKQLHANEWAHSIMRQMVSQGVPFNMAA